MKVYLVYYSHLTSGLNKALGIILVLFCLLCLPELSIGQSPDDYGESGMYFMQHFNSREYRAHHQNWAITQNDKGIIYVGNGEGVLEYDGTSWRLIDLPNHSVARSLAIDANGTIYVGAHAEFGYLKPDSTGMLYYHSLLDEVPQNERTFTNVWKVHATPQGIYFRTSTHLFLWTGEEMRIWKPEQNFHRSFWIDDVFYIRDIGVGLKKMIGDSLELVAAGKHFADQAVDIMLPYDDQQILIGSRTDGLYIFNGSDLQPFRTEADSLLESSQLYDGVLLPDGRYALATLRSGMTIVDRDGRFLKSIDESTGLQDNTVWSIATDQQGGLWLALNKGLARVEIATSFTQFDAELGLEGSVESLVRHDGILYAATGLGIYYLRPASDAGKYPEFQPVPGITTQSWALLSTERGLLAATSDGVYLISSNSAELLTELLSFTLFRSELDSHRIYIGLGDGLGYLELINSEWQFGGRISGVTEEIRSIAEDQNNNLWLGTQFYGAIHLKSINSETPKVERFDQSRNLPAGEVLVRRIGKEVLFATTQGLRRFDPSGRFVPVKVFGPEAADTLYSIPRIQENGLNQVWIEREANSRYEINELVQDSEGNYMPENNSLPRIAGFDPIWAIYPDPGNAEILWLGGDERMIRYDGRAESDQQVVFPSLIRRVKVNNELQDTTSLAELEYDRNTLRFEYTLPSYDDPSNNRFQYLLEGYDQGWSEWTAERFKEYTNLSAGDYRFRLRSRNVYMQDAMEDSYAFTILPPWWLSVWAKLIYVILGGLGIAGIVRWRTRTHQKALLKERQINDRLRQVDKIKDQFLANTSHELRTPLQGIIGLSESLYDRVEDLNQQEDLSMIISSGKRLNSLVDDILDFSRLKNYDIRLLRKPVNLRVLTDVVLRNNAPLTKGKNLKLINAIPAQLPSVYGDENRLQQILYNLVGNAIKFTETGKIEVNAREEGDFVQIRIKDTGTGIPQEKIKSIFQEFEQVDGAITREFAGTGLGLSITKRLVELHEGKLWVESTVGKGSTFYFTIPVSIEKAGMVEPETQIVENRISAERFSNAASTEAMPGVLNGSRQILVVDDEPINQQVFKNHLASHNFHLIQALNGEEALKYIETNPNIDLVLLDIMMPRMSGYEVCQKIREKYLPSELPVIMITAKNQLQDIVHGLSIGANDYLSKPFQGEELLARINTQLDLLQVFNVAEKFVPNAFLHALNRKRLTEVFLGDHAEREVTVLFTDIRDYTALSEAMTPEENFSFVNAFHGRIGPIIQRFNGFINQYLGDAIMAIFPERPEDALQAAIEIQQEIRTYNNEREQQNRLPIRIGSGLHTGSLIMGIIGDEQRMDAATISDTVNMASRIESLTKHYGTSILLSEDSIDKMEKKSTFNFRYLGKVQVKGRKEPIGLYECIDGETVEMVSLKIESQSDFQTGLDQFFNRDFPEAAATFNKILKVNPADQPVRLFLSKSSYFIYEGVSDDWTGVEIMTFK